MRKLCVLQMVVIMKHHFIFYFFPLITLSGSFAVATSVDPSIVRPTSRYPEQLLPEIDQLCIANII